MKELLLKCNKKYGELECCHSNGRPCACNECLRGGFYGGGPECYNCEKKMHYYVLNYGPSYASEIYHYLSESKILEIVSRGKKSINVLSLGCGFAPDLLAIRKYIADNRLSVHIDYHGIDESSSWNNVRIKDPHASFENGDVTSSLDFTGYDLIFIVKLFSTLKGLGKHRSFLELLTDSITRQLGPESVIVFVDVNLDSKGRDIFNPHISRLFQAARRYRFDPEGYGRFSRGWITLGIRRNVFEIPGGLSFPPSNTPLLVTGDTICFEYRNRVT